MKKTICELFAGVGGFRLGFDRLESGWETTWFSQWEPGARTQWAHDCYVSHWGEIDENTGKDISWRAELGEARKRIGDFACYVAWIYGVRAR